VNRQPALRLYDGIFHVGVDGTIAAGVDVWVTRPITAGEVAHRWDCSRSPDRQRTKEKVCGECVAARHACKKEGGKPMQQDASKKPPEAHGEQDMASPMLGVIRFADPRLGLPIALMVIKTQK
jgi:hypothetical protein